MTTIRLFRIGKKRQPSYKIVVTDKKNPPSAGRFIDEIGFYNPITKEKTIDAQKVKYWIEKGATMSDTAYNLFVTEKIIEDVKRPKHNILKKKEDDLSEKAASVKEGKVGERADKTIDKNNGEIPEGAVQEESQVSEPEVKEKPTENQDGSEKDSGNSKQEDLDQA
ncbi:MAG: 30S ribosomal protein S16 [Minisyncoccales bacterium]|jgi:small subunit ribosomal protein S16